MLKNEKAFKCANCGRITYPQRVRCLGCRGTEFEEIHFTPEGEVIAFTQLFQPPWGVDERFLNLGIVKFDNDIKAMGRFTTPDIKIGDRVKCRFEIFRVIAGENIHGWIFSPTL